MADFKNWMEELGLETKKHHMSLQVGFAQATVAQIPSGRHVSADNIDVQPKSIEELEAFMAFKAKDSGMRWRMTLSHYRLILIVEKFLARCASFSDLREAIQTIECDSPEMTQGEFAARFSISASQVQACEHCVGYPVQVNMDTGKSWRCPQCNAFGWVIIE